MKRPLEVKNKLMFAVLVIVIIFIVVVFGLFMFLFNRYDKKIYEAQINSVLFDKDFNYVKVKELATLKQRFDGLYYLYEREDNKTNKYKIGKTAVIYRADDNYVYLYGKVYQVQSTGDVSVLEGENKILQASPTKFFKLDDRRYLIVDSKIKSLGDNLINTKGYLIIELDKLGNATFANNELNFKAIKPLIITSSTFNFDIANEKLIYNDNVIDLKNIIGSTNQYKKKTENTKKSNSEKEDENTNESSQSSEGTGSNSSSSNQSYYDDYLTEVINSVNNLAGSVEKNGKNARATVNTNDVYYDFEKWLVLKKVVPSTSSISLSYQVFDPNSEYQVIFTTIKDKNGVTNTYYVNKNNAEYIIRNLIPDREYTVSFGYQSNKSTNLVIVDEVVVKTIKPSYEIIVDKIVEKQVQVNDSTRSQYLIYYTVSVDPNYVMKSGVIKYYNDGILQTENTITKSMLNAQKKYSGVIELEVNTVLGTLNTLKLENIEVCDGDTDTNCQTNVDLDVSNSFYGG